MRNLRKNQCYKVFGRGSWQIRQNYDLGTVFLWNSVGFPAFSQMESKSFTATRAFVSQYCSASILPLLKWVYGDNTPTYKTIYHLIQPQLLWDIPIQTLKSWAYLKHIFTSLYPFLQKIFCDPDGQRMGVQLTRSHEEENNMQTCLCRETFAQPKGRDQEGHHPIFIQTPSNKEFFVPPILFTIIYLISMNILLII